MSTSASGSYGCWSGDAVVAVSVRPGPGSARLHVLGTAARARQARHDGRVAAAAAPARPSRARGWGPSGKLAARASAAAPASRVTASTWRPARTRRSIRRGQEAPAIEALADINSSSSSRSFRPSSARRPTDRRGLTVRSRVCAVRGRRGRAGRPHDVHDGGAAQAGSEMKTGG